jgi:hypothetical protein
MNGWKFVPQRNSVRQLLALIFAFLVGFFGALNQKEAPSPIVIPVPRSEGCCLPAGSWAQSLGGGCIPFSDIQTLIRRQSNSDVIMRPEETTI